MNVNEILHFPSTLEEIKRGTFGITIMRDGEPVCLRMELLTDENEKEWTKFARITSSIANLNRGIFGDILALTMQNPNKNCLSYDKLKGYTGFSEQEHGEFIDKILAWKEKSGSKITNLIRSTCVGSNHMSTTSLKDKGNGYIIYASKNPDFSILTANQEEDSNLILKNYFDSYGDILTCVGSTFFNNESSFENRGIFRNPLWVFENKYAGFSMLLHGMSAAVAAKFFPEREYFNVKPVGSMQALIIKSLQPSDGYVEKNQKKIDITELEVDPNDSEGSMNYIKVEALVRIFNETIST